MDINLSSIDPISLITSNIHTITVLLLGFLSSGTLIAWIDNRYKKINSLEDKLREDRRKIYFDLLEPFVKLFNRENSREEAITYIVSEKYRRTSFEVTLIGSDAVVRAHGDLMQQTFHEVNEPKKMIGSLAALLLELRKDLEHTNTKLTKKDMLRHMITDIDEFEL